MAPTKNSPEYWICINNTNNKYNLCSYPCQHEVETTAVETEITNDTTQEAQNNNNDVNNDNLHIRNSSNDYNEI